MYDGLVLLLILPMFKKLHVKLYKKSFNNTLETELQVLQSIDFDKVTFGVIFLEADDHNTQKNAEVREYLISKGYSYRV
jgi:hypothetical protein